LNFRLTTADRTGSYRSFHAFILKKHRAENARNWRKLKLLTVPQWSHRCVAIPLGNSSSTVVPCSSRYTIIPSQHLHLMAQYILFAAVCSCGSHSREICMACGTFIESQVGCVM